MGLTGVLQQSALCFLLFAIARSQYDDYYNAQEDEGFLIGAQERRPSMRSFMRSGLPSGSGHYYTMSCNCSWGQETQENKLGFKIVGGHEVAQSSNFPMMAALVHPKLECSVCGASILTEYHILTAAHCVVGGTTLFLMVGTHFRCKDLSGDEQYIPLMPKPFIHHDYDMETNHFDIAILVTWRKITFNNVVGPACLHTEPFYAIEDPIWILGWGKDEEDGFPTPMLNKVYVKAVNIDECERKVPPGFINPHNRSTQLCTYRAEGMDACVGDSGGPLFWLDPRINRLTQIAVVSMGKGCARKDTPAINTAVYPFVGWIKDTIEKTSMMFNLDDYSYTRQFCKVIPARR